MSDEALQLFAGTERFTVRGRLGAGAFGVVYRVFDAVLEKEVALKTLERADPAALVRLKTEFRAIADVSHPNLVQLYEMHTDGGLWFFTMELVDGVNFVQHVLHDPDSTSLQLVNSVARTLDGLSDPRQLFAALPAELPQPEQHRGPTPCHIGRLRRATRQLVEGVRALHRLGKIHRDLKPSNVLVDRSGRVVLLDLGLVTEQLHRQRGTQSTELVGTPEFMSPEQALGLPVSEASDWYSLGVMLFLALTGQLPYRGNMLVALAQDRAMLGRSPADLVTGLPEDLVDLCRSLLNPRPEERPAAEQILTILRGATQEWLSDETSASSDAMRLFVGRRQQLATLGAAYQASRAGRPSAVTISGRSGMGKSALVWQFLEGLRVAEAPPLIFEGQCFEHEWVPFKAFDGLVDALHRWLRRRPRLELEAILPANFGALARLFPVLRDLLPVDGPAASTIADPLELRRQGFLALRAIFTKLAGEAGLVLVIDDLQWGDADSASLLETLLLPPEPPPLLLVVNFRSEDGVDSPMIAQCLRLAREQAHVISVHQLALGELSVQQSLEMALHLVGDQPELVEAAQRIAAEAAGSPFFVAELARHMRRHTRISEGERPLSFDAVLQQRLSELKPPARSLLDLVALAAQPVSLSLLRAVSPESVDVHELLTTLRGLRLVRTRGGLAAVTQMFHDRIRSLVLSGIGDEQAREMHRRWVRALADSAEAQPEAVAIHLLGAGETAQAREYAARAARRAAQALAFDRAAMLYRMAIEIDGARVDRVILEELGEALSNAGRGLEAADAFLQAAEGVPRGEGMPLYRRAAEQLLRSGHIDRGLAVVQRVLAAAGLMNVTTPGTALLALALRRAMIRTRGLRFRSRPAAEVPPLLLERIDTCWSVAAGLGRVDTMRGAYFQSNNLWYALRAGEPYRLARALAMEAGFSAMGGIRHHKRSRQLLRVTEQLALETGNPHAMALAKLARGTVRFLQGRWRVALEGLDLALDELRTRCTGVWWELDTGQFFLLQTLYLTGDLPRLAKMVPELTKDADERGDLYAAFTLRNRFSTLLSLAADQPVAAREGMRQATEQWSHQGFHLQHFWDLVSRVEIALYRGDGQAAWHILGEIWPALERSRLLRIAFTKTQAYHVRARAALACYRVQGSDSSLRRIAEDACRRLGRQRESWAQALSTLGQAAIIGWNRSGANGEVLDLLALAEERLLAAQMELYAMATRRVRGVVQADYAGERLVAEAEEWMRRQGVVDPARFATMLVPGLL